MYPIFYLLKGDYMCYCTVSLGDVLVGCRIRGICNGQPDPEVRLLDPKVFERTCNKSVQTTPAQFQDR